MSYKNIYNTYFSTSDKVERVQLKFVLWGTSVSYIFGMFFNLFLPAIGVYEYIWLGPSFTLVMIFSIGYAIIKHHLFNKKIILAETLVFSLWFIILIRTITSNTLRDQLINGLLLFVVVLLGIFLIKRVIKEVETREKIEGLADNLKKANVRLRELDKQKSEFVSIASHQLRTPLTAIKGYASMLLEGSFDKVPKENKEPLRRIYQSSQNLVNIVSDFLSVTRIEQGRTVYKLEKVNIKKLLQDTIEELRPTIDIPGLSLTMDFSKELKDADYMTNVDKGKLREVFINLIDNAIKYTPKGSIKITATANKKKKTVIISIADTGIGIPKKFSKNLFGKFNRAENGKKIQANGSGIGLYIAREIVEAHKGRIWAESEGEGKGTVFFVELPGV